MGHPPAWGTGKGLGLGEGLRPAQSAGGVWDEVGAHKGFPSTIPGFTKSSAAYGPPPVPRP